MKTQCDDPRLTAYALGELEGAEREEIEELVAQNADARQAVEEIQRLGRELTNELSTEAAQGMTPLQKQNMLQSFDLEQTGELESGSAGLQKKTVLLKKQGTPQRVISTPWRAAIAMAASIAIIVGMFGVFGDTVRQKMGGAIEELGGDSGDMDYALNTDSADFLCDLTDAPREERHNGPNSLFGPSIEDYSQIIENTFQRVVDHPLSTFSIDVDTASYSNVRRFLSDGRMPPKDAVRIEELINYFNYDYAPPRGKVPFATHLEVSSCPWRDATRLVRIGLKGRVIENKERPPCNLVFLLDVSGSMDTANKLALLKRAMSALVNNLNARDRVAIVVYAGAAGLVLPPTACDNRNAIQEALRKLKSGGSTAGGAGIKLAYKTAAENLDPEAANRVILCTDGDFNVGITQTGDLTRFVAKKAKQGIFLTVLGFGMGNYKDSRLEQIADKGNGNYAYIDTFSEARKVLVDQISGTLVTIAKDVKIQVEFNPDRVAEYRLVGYENRILKKEDFNDDKKDAGEIGAGHTVTALYEIVPTGRSVMSKPPVDQLKYRRSISQPVESANAELLTVKLRYKFPDADISTKIEFPLMDDGKSFEESSTDFRFASAVASFGMLLRDSRYKNEMTYSRILQMAGDALGRDKHGYRREFLDLVRNAEAISGR
jgi:Ca-activated chloride channel family protein